MSVNKHVKEYHMKNGSEIQISLRNVHIVFFSLYFIHRPEMEQHLMGRCVTHACNISQQRGFLLTLSRRHNPAALLTLYVTDLFVGYSISLQCRLEEVSGFTVTETRKHRGAQSWLLWARPTFPQWRQL